MGFSMERPQYPGSSVCLLYTAEQGDEVHLDWRSLGRGAVSGYKQDWRGRKLQQVFFVLSVGTGSWTQGRLCRSSLCATLIGLRHRGTSRHDCARVNHTCKLRMSLTRCTHAIFKSIPEAGTPHGKYPSGDAGSRSPKCWP